MVLKKATLVEEFLNRDAELPYGLTVREVQWAMNETYGLLYDLNGFLVRQGHERLEDMLLGNSFSGVVSEVIVRALVKHSKTLTRNLQVGGHPDLILRGRHESDRVLRAPDGIEVKVSRQAGGWQGHNPEKVWLLIFRYKKLDELSEQNKPVEEREPLTFVEVLGAKINKSDWSFSGRSGESRRTITASITRAGMTRLRSNPIYRDPVFAIRSR